MFRCNKCNITTGYFFACTKVEQEENAEFTKRKEYMCLKCVQGQELIYGWKNDD